VKKAKSLTIRQVRGKAKCTERQKECLKGIGLRRIGHTVTRQDTRELRGLIARIPHLVEIVEE
jgi:large subunit ribosomal protein L30